MTFGLLRTKLAAMVEGAVQVQALPARLVPTTRRTLSQPRTSATPPVVKLIRTTAARSDDGIRWTIWTPFTLPLVLPVTTLRPVTSARDLSVAAPTASLPRETR